MSVHMLCHGSSYASRAPDHHLKLLLDCRAMAVQREQRNPSTASSKQDINRAMQERHIRTPKEVQQPGRLLNSFCCSLTWGRPGRHSAPCRRPRMPATRMPSEHLLLQFDMR